MINRRNFLIAAPIGVAAFSQSARATTYFTSATVREALFPSATNFIDRSVILTSEQSKAISKASSARVTKSKIAAWEARGPSGKLGTMFIDQVYGKHEFITYAVALGPDGDVRQIEIMDYRETYGDQIRIPKWRAQFTGKRHGQPLKFTKEIKNISGATLSCLHITDGVRRVLATYALVIAQA
jgi:Na+-translocating ferredoxin:NAD+ oxidoreductase RnfG subunit